MEKKTKILFVALSLIIGILLLAYLYSTQELLQNILLIIIILTILIGLSWLYWDFFGKIYRTRKKLAKLSKLLFQEPLHTLEQLYLETHHLYLQLSEKQKAQVYPHLEQVRSRLEQQFQAEKKIEQLLLDVERKTFWELNNDFKQIKELLPLLPRKAQERYSPSLLHLKERMEKGR